ncbi:MAG: 50S ribosomal protein L22 [Chitinispirillales bacterium]|jgi:large subunit ribosomal protein L22|nr:50S ribosomal protein L22 [Chitinispirillales bacterium]
MVDKKEEKRIPQAGAKVKNIRSSARKARLVVDEVRGKKVGEALALLKFSIHKHVSRDVEKLIKSALANLEYKNSDINIEPKDVVVKAIWVDEGATLKRFQPKAQGRAGRILKRMCHISVIVASNVENN